MEPLKCLTELENLSIKHDLSNCACSSDSFFTDNRTNLPSEFPVRVNQNNTFPEDINKIPYLVVFIAKPFPIVSHALEILLKERLSISFLHFDINLMMGNLNITFCCHMPCKETAC